MLSENFEQILMRHVLTALLNSCALVDEAALFARSVTDRGARRQLSARDTIGVAVVARRRRMSSGG